MKKNQKKLLKPHSIKELLPYETSINENRIIKLKNKKGYMTVLGVNGVGFNKISFNTALKYAEEFENFNHVFPNDYQIVSMLFPEETPDQQNWWKKQVTLSKKEGNREAEKISTNNLEELRLVEREYLRQEYFLFLFDKTEKDLKNTINRALSLSKSSTGLNFNILENEKILRVLFQLNNLNSSPHKSLSELSNEELNENFLNIVSPESFVKFSDTYWRTADGYYSVLNVVDFPSSNLPLGWGLPLNQQENTATFFQLGTEDSEEMKKLLSKLTEEKIDNANNANKVTEESTDLIQATEATRIFNEIANENKSMKRMYVRIVVFDKTHLGLKKRIKAIKENLSQFKLKINLGELRLDYESLYTPSMQIEYLPNKRKGNAITTRDLGGSYYLDHLSLKDEHGANYGRTDTGGLFAFDLFKKTNHRLRPFAAILGNSGTGKSVFLKELIINQVAQRNKIRNFDLGTGHEYSKLTKKFNGTIIDMADPLNRVNLFEIVSSATKTVVKEDGSESEEINELEAFTNHVEKIKQIASFLNEDFRDKDLNKLNSLIIDFYIQHGLWPNDPENNPEDIRVLGLPHDQYPKLRDFVSFLSSRANRTRKDSKFISSEIETIQNLHDSFKALLDGNKELLDGPTEIPEISSQQLVTFDGTGLHQRSIQTKNIQIFTMLNYVESEIIRNSVIQNKKLLNNETERDDIQYYLLNIDEAQNVLNDKFIPGVEFITSMLQQFRKNYAALIVSMPSVKELIPEVNQQALNEKQSKLRSLIRVLFSLFQYRFFFQIDASDIPEISSALDKSISEDELQTLHGLSRQELFLNINGDINIPARLNDLSDEQIKLFQGGE